jgi:hypothetical protein
MTQVSFTSSASFDSALTQPVGASLKPSISLNFSKQETLDPRLTFTRASTATYYDRNGILRTAGYGQPRFDHDPNTKESLGLLMEDGKTNLFQLSNYFSFSPWTTGNISGLGQNAVLAPDGTNTGWLFTEDTVASQQHLLFQSIGTLVAGTKYTLSWYAKAYTAPNGVTRGFGLTMHGGSWAYFNLQTGTVINNGGWDNYGIQYVGNGWYRCFITGSAPTTSGNMYCAPINTTTNSHVYTGDGQSGMYVWGAQVEQSTALSSYIPSLPTFSARAGTATFTNVLGTLTVAASGVARVNHRYVGKTQLISQGPLYEPAATNIATFSEDLGNAGRWSNVAMTVTANSTDTADPYGTTISERFAETTANNFHCLYNIVNFTTTAGGLYTASIYVKAYGATQFVQLILDDAVTTNGASANFSIARSLGYLVTGTGGNYGASTGFKASITPVWNGWFRISVTTTLTTTTSRVVLSSLNSATAGKFATFTGVATNGFYAFGAQLELSNGSNFPSSYIPSTSTTATARVADTITGATTARSTDLLSLRRANFMKYYNYDQGTINVEFRQPNGINPARLTVIDDGSNFTNTGGIGLDYSTATTLRTEIFVRNVQYASTTATLVPNAITKNNVALAYSVPNISLAANGAIIATATTTALPKSGISVANIGSWTPAGSFNGWLYKWAYTPKKLTDNELIDLTSIETSNL